MLSIFTRHCCLAGDSHTAALTEKGAVYAWGTYRDATGVFGFAPGVRVGLLATLVWDPKKAAEQAVKVASGMDLSFAALLLACTMTPHLLFLGPYRAPEEVPCIFCWYTFFSRCCANIMHIMTHRTHSYTGDHCAPLLLPCKVEFTLCHRAV